MSRIVLVFEGTQRKSEFCKLGGVAHEKTGKIFLLSSADYRSGADAIINFVQTTWTVQQVSQTRRDTLSRKFRSGDGVIIEVPDLPDYTEHSPGHSAWAV